MGKDVLLGRDYEKDLAIDMNNLHKEWERQPHIFMLYAEAAADAKLRVDKLREEVEVIKAEIATDIRSSPESYGFTRVTESQVKELVLQDGRYAKAMERYLRAKHEYEILAAAVKAFDQRKSALENLVRLYGQQYFSTPVVPDSEPFAQERREMVRTRILERLNPVGGDKE